MGQADVEESLFNAIDIQVRHWEESSVTRTDQTKADLIVVKAKVV